MSNLRVYFARAMDARSPAEILLDDQRYLEFLAPIGASLINPFSSQTACPLDDGYDTAEQDLEALRCSDLVLADLSLPDYQYVGCIFEIVHAAIQKIPVILVVGQRNFDRFFFHAYCEFIARESNEAVQYIRRAHTQIGIKGQLEEMRAYYEKAAPTYGYTTKAPNEGNPEEVDAFFAERRELRRVLLQNVSKRTLEVGFGTGDWTRTICERAEKVVGIDVSQGMYKEARKNLLMFQNLQLLHGDIFEQDLVPPGFDCVVLYFILSVLPPSEQEKLFQRVSDLLVPGGLIIAADTRKVWNQHSIGLGRRRLQRRLIDGQSFVLYKEHFPGAALSRLLQEKSYEVLESSKNTVWFSWAVARKSDS